MEERTSDMHVGKAPEPGKNCPENAVVKTVAMGADHGAAGRNPNNYLRTSTSVIYSPPAKEEPVKSDDELKAEEAQAKTVAKAADTEVSDAEFIKWLRLQYIGDLQKRRAEYEKLEAK